MTVYSLYIYKTILNVRNNKSNIGVKLTYTVIILEIKNKYSVKKHTKEKFQESPILMGMKFINYLPERIKQDNNIIIFKNKLKSKTKCN